VKHLTLQEEFSDILFSKICVMYSTRYSCQILMAIEFSIDIFQESSNIKFYENLSIDSQVVSCRQTDRKT